MDSSRKRLEGELTFMLLLLAFSIFMLWVAYNISKFESLSSAGAFPMVATAVMALCAMRIVWRTVRLERAHALDGESRSARFVRQITPRVGIAFTVVIVAYMVLLEPLGFLLASCLFLVMSMRLLGSQRWGLNLLVSVLSLGAIHVIFQTMFSVVLPTGIWLTRWIS